MSKIHFKGLNTYRAIAALLVVVGHIEMFKSKHGLAHYLNEPYFYYTGGHIGVVLFFALSGFLITYLLLRERSEKKEISLKNFYMRRILRVWPVYFLVLLISYLCTDFVPAPITLLLCLTIFPNVAHALNKDWTVSPQIWSIGAEEQFYLVWPFLLKTFKNILLVSAFIYFSLLLFPHVAVRLLTKYASQPAGAIEFINNLFYGTKFSCMASGAFFACIYFIKPRILDAFYSWKIMNYLLVALPFVLWFSSFHVIYVNDEFYSVLFGISILLIATNPNLVDIDTKLGTFLGKISYGIYMYHWIILEVLFRNGLYRDFHQSLLTTAVLYAETIALTILVAAASYYGLERRILLKKEQYS